VSSPWLSNETWEYDRRKWLERNFDIKPSDFISATDKFHVAGDVLVDDKPEHVNKWSSTHDSCGVLFGHPYNESASLRAARRIGSDGTWTAENVGEIVSHLAER
jgi:5'(3')-deoxyribonucleotidase